MDNTGIKVRIFDMEHGLREYENIKIIRIISNMKVLNLTNLRFNS